MSEVVFVGAGPGDPELITVKGLKALERADVVVYAGSLVNPALLGHLKPSAQAHDSAPLTLEAVLGLLAEAALAGKAVVRLHTGDPSLYGAIQEQIEALQKLGVRSRVIPGVTAAFAAAATLGQELTLPGVSQTVILGRAPGRTPVPEGENIRELAAIGGTLCLYLSVGLLEAVVKELLAAGTYNEDTPVAVVSRASWPDERIVEAPLGRIARDVAQAGITRQAMIVVGEVLRARTQGVPEPSRLYAPDFSHGYREKL